MIVHLYKGGEIAIPLKHGSRFVRQHYKSFIGDMIEVSTRSMEWISGVKWIVLRDPVENLKSALHTEVMENDYLDDRDKVDNLLFHHYYRPHYGNHFDISLCKSLYESGVAFKVVKLESLSIFLYNITGWFSQHSFVKDWIPKHDTPYEMGREEFWYEFCKRYPTDSSKLMELALEDRKYYELLLKEKEFKLSRLQSKVI